MPWDGTEQQELGVDCLGGAGSSADGPWIRLGTKELAEYTVHRTDAPAAMTERWLIDVIRSSNKARESEPHPRYMLEGNEEVFTFPVEGTYSFKIRVSNAETGPTETVETDHYWRLDGMDL